MATTIAALTAFPPLDLGRMHDALLHAAPFSL
jgi:hypothetical protein